MCLNQYMEKYIQVFESIYPFATSQETVSLIKRYQEIRIPHFVTYLSVPIPPFKNRLHKSLCEKERDQKRDRGKKRKEREKESVSEKKR